ncbi:hypothetical protein F5B20DRAFT_594706 [Whalleya microplaca]|nr:hypothetical protein F5B20DRAFT_594706 [Whalleya microplaca]
MDSNRPFANLEATESDVGDSLVTVQIPSGKEFVVHKSLLESASPFFHAALNTGMVEATTGKVKLVEHADDITFTLFLVWLYDTSHLLATTDLLQHLRDLQPGPKLLEPCVKAWLLGDFLLVTDFKDAIIRMIWFMDRGGSSVDDLYEELIEVLPKWTIPTGSGLQRLLFYFLRLWLEDGGSPSSSHPEREGERGRKIEELDPEMLLEFTKFMVDKTARLMEADRQDQCRTPCPVCRVRLPIYLTHVCHKGSLMRPCDNVSDFFEKGN